MAATAELGVVVGEGGMTTVRPTRLWGKGGGDDDGVTNTVVWEDDGATSYGRSSCHGR
jgi:hypothetical protein